VSNDGGAKFRKHHASLETSRSFVPKGVPVLATSVTMPPVTPENVRSVLGMNVEILFHLNLGNDRHNLVRDSSGPWNLEGGASNFAALDFVVRGRDRPLRTVIYYFDSKRLQLPSKKTWPFTSAYSRRTSH